MKIKFLFQQSAYEANDRAAKVLKAAKHVLAKDGHVAFGLRAVAREAGVSLGAVQHFFPTNQELLIGTLEYIANEYLDSRQTIIGQLPLNGPARLSRFMDFLVEDLFRPETRRFWLTLWGLSGQDKLVERALDQMYVHHCRELAVLISNARPTLPEPRCHEIALSVVTMIEGMLLFTAPRSSHKLSRTALKKLVQKTVAALLVDPDSQS